MGKFVSKMEASRLADALMKVVGYRQQDALKWAARTAVSRLWTELPAKTDGTDKAAPSDEIVVKRVEVWTKFWEEKGMLGEVEVGKQILSELALPF